MCPRTDAFDSNCDASDPSELIELKRKLALVTCSCPVCQKIKPSTAEFLLNPRDQQVQVKPPNINMNHQYIQANPEGIKKDKEVLFNSVTRDVLCPSCYATMNILRGGAIRILKDEECEVNPRLFMDDKSVEVQATFDDQSTSYLGKSSLEVSNVALCDIMPDLFYRDFTNSALTPEKRPQVNFKCLRPEVVNTSEVTQNLDNRFGHCMCLESFIESIRPPLDRHLVFK